VVPDELGAMADGIDIINQARKEGEGERGRKRGYR